MSLDPRSDQVEVLQLSVLGTETPIVALKPLGSRVTHLPSPTVFYFLLLFIRSISLEDCATQISETFTLIPFVLLRNLNTGTHCLAQSCSSAKRTLGPLIDPVLT